MAYNVTSESELIILGEAGENEAETVEIDFSEWASEYGTGTLTLRHQRADSELYSITPTVSGTTATWEISDVDTGVEGTGRLQVVYTVDDVVVKSVIWKTFVYDSLDEGEIPDPYVSWLAQMEAYATSAADSAEAAAASAASLVTDTELDDESTNAVQNKVITTALSTKAEIDGAYDSMTVGNAEQLVSTNYVEDSVPYLFRTAGGSADIGNRAYDEIVGGSIVWNQSLDISSFTSTNSDSRSLLFMVQTRYTNEGSLVYTNYLTNYITSTGIYAGIFNATNPIEAIRAKHNGSSLDIIIFDWATQSIASGHKVLFTIDFTGIDTTTTGGVTAENIQLFDLTAMFGSTIADHIYTLEQSTTGAGVAWFKSLFPNSYYEYNAGELMSVEGLTSHDTVGFNAWDEEWEVGTISTSGNNSSSTTAFRTKNHIRCLPDTTYYISAPQGSTSYIRPFFYDSDKSLISIDGWKIGGVTIETPSNCMYMRFVFSEAGYGGTTYNNDICINLSWSGYRNGEYEAYTKHSYPLDSTLTLRGVPKLDSSGNLYYDGDTYAADGTVTRRYGIVDLGTLSWTYYENGGYFRTAMMSEIKAPAATEIANIVCEKYVSSAWNYIDDKTVAISTASRIIVEDTSYATVEAFTTAMSGVYLVYELATETTETADSYQSPQVVDDFGTEEYVTTSIVPVGHTTQYPANLRDKLQHLPDLADDDGVYVITQSDNDMSLTALPTELPTAPTTDGTYVLKVTVSSGTATYSWESE